jgi:hypothetical protein
MRMDGGNDMNLAAPKISQNPNVKQAIEDGEGILRLTPAWVPRSFLMPGRRLRLHPDDYYALGAHRGGIDERWFASTTEAANENREPDEGLSYVLHNGERFTLRDAIGIEGANIIGEQLWSKYQRWPVYSKFFDNQGPIPLHLHQDAKLASLVGQEGKPESYYFPPQLNNVDQAFPHTYFGLEPGTTKEEIRACLERWNQGDNGILKYSKAYRLYPGTGWLIPPNILHAPGSLLRYEPRGGSDVFGRYQARVEGRFVPWNLLVKDMPEAKHQDLDFIVDTIDWDVNTHTHFKDNHYLEPIPVKDTSKEGWLDKWIVYGDDNGHQFVTAKELTIQPNTEVEIKDTGAYGLITVQGSGTIGNMRIHSHAMIRFGELTEDEVFVTHDAANSGVLFKNTGPEPLVTLRYFGPEMCSAAPKVGDHKKV